jgi:hypothetical protein
MLFNVHLLWRWEVDAPLAGSRRGGDFNRGRAPRVRDSASMRRLLRIAAFGSPLMVVDEVTFLLLAVEVWSDGVHVRAAPEACPRTEALTAVWREEHLTWRASGRAGTLPSGMLPDVRTLVHVSDDVATPFAARGISVTSQWRYEWMFEPGPAEGATRIVIGPAGRAAPLGSSVALTLSDL